MTFKCQGMHLILLTLEYHHSIYSSDAGVLLFSKFEFSPFSGKIIVAVGRYIPECNVIFLCSSHHPERYPDSETYLH
ncbi:hypothetical protein MTR_8g099355 [Medicago truncatula]|uniref:Uncharacterized protein n=1 Tax=Medicago truncatula TaxID=3880 RepID=A0A072TVJ7_MEDTR|nr:hypothetical protein MTR_8g099355 [Medicago truncatula]